MVDWHGPGAHAVVGRDATVAGADGTSGAWSHGAIGMTVTALAMRPTPPHVPVLIPPFLPPALLPPIATRCTAHPLLTDAATHLPWRYPLVARGVNAASAARPTGRIEEGQLFAAVALARRRPQPSGREAAACLATDILAVVVPVPPGRAAWTGRPASPCPRAVLTS